MNTISLISSISFNSLPFFEAVISSQLSNGIIDYAHWIVHHPEDDETKSHIHFVVRPSKRIDTNAYQKMFLEPYPGEERPRSVLPFNKTKNISDWLLYAIHDVRYLLKKGESRRIHYNRDDVRSTSPELLLEQFRETADPLQVMTSRVLELKAAGESWGDIIASGLIPPNQFLFYRDLFYATDGTDRGGRGKHA